MLVLPETTKYEAIFNFIGAYTFIYLFLLKGQHYIENQLESLFTQSFY